MVYYCETILFNLTTTQTVCPISLVYDRYGEFFQLGVVKWLFDTNNPRTYKRKGLGRAVDSTIKEVS